MLTKVVKTLLLYTIALMGFQIGCKAALHVQEMAMLPRVSTFFFFFLIKDRNSIR